MTINLWPPINLLSRRFKNFFGPEIFALKFFALKFWVLIFYLIFSANSGAQNIDQNLIDQQDWISRQQQNQIEENRRSYESEAITKERARNKKQAQEDAENQIPISNQSARCFSIKSIVLEDANSLSKFRKKKLLNPFIGKCAEAKILTDIITVIQNYYNDKGYVTARVLVPKQNIQNGNIELKMIEGKIDKVIINNNHFVDKMQALTAFGFIQEKTLNLNQINQGIFQINRLSSNNATMKIEPSTLDGFSNVYVSNKSKFPVHAMIGHDNLGNDFTGIYRTNFSSSLDNLLFLNDNINLSYSTNINDKARDKGIKSFSSNISIPFGFNTLIYNYSRSEFRGTNQGNSGPIRITGFSQSYSSSIERLIFNRENFRLTTSASLFNKSSVSYLNNAKIETSERKLTVASVGFVVSNYFKNGINFYFKPSYFKGLKILNAKQDAPDLIVEAPRAQFDYFKLYISTSKKILIPQINIPFTISTEFDSQRSKDTLFGSEQFSVGGYYSVRGFRENYINGDSGYYFRNKINLNIGQIVAPFARPCMHKTEQNDLSFINKNLSHFNKLSIEPFFDYGYVKNKYVSNSADGRLSGLGLKALFNSKYFNASITYSSANGKSRLISSYKQENKMIYFELSASCC
ncbi:MAG: ShlB/FhaC/HecB family hemolysin secretion/activation protein [Alphaproteobacteria bacterium]|nr:ShlB/FhaC/HecB family hemolysin secretion/activation protein [Alphaproteobacteria bacterium]